MWVLNDKQVKDLSLKANEARKLVIDALLLAGSGHTAGSLGMADVLTSLYFGILKHNPEKPNWDGRDRLVLSNGHICPILYAVMSLAGYFSKTEMKKLRRFGSKLQGHPHREWLPGIETSSGPLGSGLSQTIGMALANRIDNGKTSDKFFYCLMGDGELDEGQVWEAVMLAGKENLGNVIAFVDRNNIQIEGFTEDVMPLEPLADKFKSFNWTVEVINGHNFEEIFGAVNRAKAIFNNPTVIIANTIPGKGVSDFERKFEWHGKAPNKDEAKKAMKSLDSLDGRVENPNY